MRIEILPIEDSSPHTIGGLCKCWPDLIFESENVIVVHNAYDGRVAVENAKKILNIEQTPDKWQVIIE